jgi:RNA polymerase sigma-70 factor (ECF subfamily)
MSTVGAQIADWMLVPASALGPSGNSDVESRDDAQVTAPANLDAEVNASIAALVEQYSSALYRVAYSVTRNAAEAEDAVQDAFLRVIRHRGELKEIRDIRVWLVRITWNVVLDRKRRAKTRPENEDIENVARLLVSPELSADRRAIAAQRHALVLRLIDKLPAKEREVLLLSAFDELSTVQIAAVAGTTESSVRSRLFRARKMLASMLDADAAWAETRPL